MDSPVAEDGDRSPNAQPDDNDDNAHISSAALPDAAAAASGAGSGV